MQPDTTPLARILTDAGVSADVAVDPTTGLVARVGAADVRRTLEALKGSVRVYDFLVDLFGIDTGQGVDLIYMVRSFVSDDELIVRTSLPYGGEIASVWEIHPAVLMPEREAAEMFGLSLAGHPNPKRLLTTEAAPSLLLKSVELRGPEEVRNR